MPCTILAFQLSSNFLYLHMEMSTDILKLLVCFFLSGVFIDIVIQHCSKQQGKSPTAVKTEASVMASVLALNANLKYDSHGKRFQIINESGSTGASQ